MLEAKNLVNLTILAADNHLADDQPGRAVDVLLDGMQYGRDLMAAPLLINRMVGCAMLAIASKEALIDDDLLARIPAGQLERLARGMARLDAALPGPKLCMDGEISRFIQLVGESSSRTDPFISGWSSLEAWRFGFSTRAMYADYVQVSLHLRNRQLELEHLPWPQQSAQLDALAEELADSSNPLTGHLRAFPRAAEPAVGITTLLRLTRMAAEYQLTGHATPLPDPFGTQLTVIEIDGTVRIESVGPGDERKRARYSLELAARDD